MRETPAGPILKTLIEEGATINVYDPVARLPEDASDGCISIQSSMRDAVKGAAVVVIVTAWEEFKSLPTLLEELGADPYVVDGRRMIPTI